MSVEEVRALYELKLEGTNIYRWGKFDRVTVGELLEEINKLTERIKELEQYQGRYGDATIEIHRLRCLLQAHRLDPDRCENFPGGEQCALKARHEGVCKWGRGD